ncbi:YafY family protein [uncultured Enterococcus sp.]|uniref:helix-turn-helix transcriptional regulator n=1 Tax=uncultured Enterococcus sp. TaxID=167972 RepID=UPI002AA93878|nr:YafY family protein [uncultured Enterococcus sp.]
MQINRLFEIVYILLDRKSVTAKELTEYFGVSRRTICRDIDALSTAGIPVYTKRGKGGGISLLPNFVLNKSLLNEEEQTEILSALYGLSSIKTEDTDHVLQKLSTRFNKTITNWMDVDFSGWSHENDFFNDFKTAIVQQRIVEFDYYNREGEKTFRRVEPIQVWFKSKAWYLRGFSLAKQDIRLFKIGRIKNLVVTDQSFTARDPLLLSDKVDSLTPEEPNLIKIKLRIEPERAFRVFDDFHESMVEKQPDGGFIATVFWPEDNWLYGFILSFGGYAEVLEPAHLRTFIKNEAQTISKKYL